MNAADRKALAKLCADISGALATLEDCKSELESLKDAEREKFDNMSEGLQQGERGQNIEQAADALDEAYSTIEEALDNLNNAVNDLEGIS